MKKKNNPFIIPVDYPAIENCADRETLGLLGRFQALRAANYELTQTWCIKPGSENPIRWNSTTAYLNLRTGVLDIKSAPGVAFMVDGLALDGGIFVVYSSDDDYLLHVTDFAHDNAVTVLPPIKDKDLIATLDRIINGDATRAERIAHLATIDPTMAEAILAGKRVLIL